VVDWVEEGLVAAWKAGVVDFVARQVDLPEETRVAEGWEEADSVAATEAAAEKEEEA
jgi:hypothetical protein